MAKSQPTTAPRLISICDLCETLGVKRTKAFELIRYGEVKSITIGRRRLILLESVDALIERRLQEGDR